MYYIYAIYSAISGLVIVICLYCMAVYINAGLYRNNSMFALLNLLFSILVTAIGCQITRWDCLAASAMITIGLTSVCLWLSFVMFVTQTRQRIVWRSAKLTMVLVAYLLPGLMYLLIYLLIGLARYEQDQYFCTLQKEQTNIVSIVCFVLTLTAFQLVVLMYMVLQSVKCLQFINRSVSRFQFLKSAYYETIAMPLVITLLILPYFVLWNLSFIESNQTYLLVIQVSQLCMVLGLLLTALSYGFNPTILKVTVIRSLFAFRTQLEQQFRAQQI